MSARVKLLDAAASLARREGVTALGVERVVGEAEVSKGTFFYHFSTKQDMVRELLQYVADQHMGAVEAEVVAGKTFTEALVDMIIREAADGGTLVHVVVASVALDPSLRSVLTARSAAWRQRMIDDDGLDPAEADRVSLAIDGFMIGSVLYEDGDGSLGVESRKAAIRSLVPDRRPL